MNINLPQAHERKHVKSRWSKTNTSKDFCHSTCHKIAHTQSGYCGAQSTLTTKRQKTARAIHRCSVQKVLTRHILQINTVDPWIFCKYTSHKLVPPRTDPRKHYTSPSTMNRLLYKTYSSMVHTPEWANIHTSAVRHCDLHLHLGSNQRSCIHCRCQCRNCMVMSTTEEFCCRKASSHWLMFGLKVWDTGMIGEREREFYTQIVWLRRCNTESRGF